MDADKFFWSSLRLYKIWLQLGVNESLLGFQQHNNNIFYFLHNGRAFQHLKTNYTITHTIKQHTTQKITCNTEYEDKI